VSDPNETNAPTTLPITGVAGTGEAGDTAASTPEQPTATSAPAPAPAPEGVTTDPVAPGDTNLSLRDAFQPDVHAACAALDEIERIALFWGGDRGAQIRNQTTLARLALTGQSHNE